MPLSRSDGNQGWDVQFVILESCENFTVSADKKLIVFVTTRKFRDFDYRLDRGFFHRVSLIEPLCWLPPSNI